MIFPTVHLNGTSRSDLFEGYILAHRAVVDARMALQNAYPNGRDYYPQGISALHDAEVEHEARLNALVEIENDLLALAESVQDA